MAWVLTTVFLTAMAWLAISAKNGGKKQRAFIERMSPEIEALKTRAHARAYRVTQQTQGS